MECLSTSSAPFCCSNSNNNIKCQECNLATAKLQLSSLSDDMLLLIISFCQLKTNLKNFCLVSHRFNELVQGDPFWQLVTQTLYPLHSQCLLASRKYVSWRYEFKLLHSFGFQQYDQLPEVVKREIKIKKLGKVALGKYNCHSIQQYRLLLANQGFSTGKHLYKVSIEKLGDLFSPGIGICRAPSDMAFSEADLSVLGWSWFGSLGTRYNQGANYPPNVSSTSTSFHSKLRKGDTVHVFVDVDSMRIEFIHNGTHLEQCSFSGAREWKDRRDVKFKKMNEKNQVDQTMYLAISLNGKSNRVRIVSHEQVAKHASFENVLEYIKGRQVREEKSGLKTQQQRKASISLVPQSNCIVS